MNKYNILQDNGNVYWTNFFKFLRECSSLEELLKFVSNEEIQFAIDYADKAQFGYPLYSRIKEKIDELDDKEDINVNNTAE